MSEIYAVIEVFFLFSPMRYAYSIILFCVALVFIIAKYAQNKKPHMLLLMFALVFFFLNYVLPWQNLAFHAEYQNI